MDCMHGMIKEKEMSYKIPSCKFNRFVECNVQNNCGICGWNPKEHERRLIKKVGKEKAHELIKQSEDITKEKNKNKK